MFLCSAKWGLILPHGFRYNGMTFKHVCEFCFQKHCPDTPDPVGHITVYLVVMHRIESSWKITNNTKLGIGIKVITLAKKMKRSPDEGLV